MVWSVGFIRTRGATVGVLRLWLSKGLGVLSWCVQLSGLLNDDCGVDCLADIGTLAERLKSGCSTNLASSLNF